MGSLAPRGWQLTVPPSDAVAADTRRYGSVDVLRGLAVAAMLVVNDAGDWSHVYPWLEHAEWNGCTAADLVFPTFLFVVGVSIALASRVIGPGERSAQIAAVAWRALRMLLLGIALNLLAHWTIPDRDFRWAGVLQRIALCYAIVAMMAIGLSARVCRAAAAVLLAGYGVVLACGGPLQPGASIVDRVDTLVLRRHAYLFDPATGLARDPEGILSTLPAIVTTLCGWQAGLWLQRGRVRRLLAAALFAASAGLLLSAVQPMNKALWTPAFVLWSGAFAGCALALLHALVDRLGWRVPGRVFGRNAIVAYAGGWIAACLLALGAAQAGIHRVLFAWPLAGFDPRLASLAYACAFTGACWLGVRAMERRSIRIVI